MYIISVDLTLKKYRFDTFIGFFFPVNTLRVRMLMIIGMSIVSKKIVHVYFFTSILHLYIFFTIYN
jgi:hypothetical protein